MLRFDIPIALTLPYPVQKSLPQQSPENNPLTNKQSLPAPQPPTPLAAGAHTAARIHVYVVIVIHHPRRHRPTGRLPVRIRVRLPRPHNTVPEQSRVQSPQNHSRRNSNASVTHTDGMGLSESRTKSIPFSLLLHQLSMFGHEESRHAACVFTDSVRNRPCSAVGVQRRYKTCRSSEVDLLDKS